MPRIRSIKPEFWRSPSTAKASPLARLLYIAMWGWADDYGAAEWTYRELLGYAFPHDENIGNAELQSLLTEVATCFGTEFYVVDGRRYYYIPKWDKHQKNERRAQGKFPLPDAPDASVDAEFHPDAEMRGSSVQTSGSTVSGTGEQGTGEQGKKEQGNSPAAIIRLFDEAYEHWPKKVERKVALEKFRAATKKMPAEDLAAHVICFGDAYAATTERQFTPALGVWLGKERWTDELPSANASSQLSGRSQTALSTLAYYADQQNEQQRGIAQ